MLTLRKTTADDAAFWKRLGKAMPQGGETYMIEDGAQHIGVLHYTLLWEELPFLNLLLIREDKRGVGYGKGALALWEENLRAAGYCTALLSTRKSESGQQFFRKLGYADCGALDMRGFARPQPDEELFLYKNL